MITRTKTVIQLKSLEIFKIIFKQKQKKNNNFIKN